MKKIIIPFILASLILTGCSASKSEPLLSKLELKANDFGSEFIAPDDNSKSILSVFNIGAELTCFYGKDYSTATTPFILSNSLQSPSVPLLKSRVDQFKTSSMASKYYEILSSKKGRKCFEKNYATNLSSTLSQSGTRLEDVTTVRSETSSKNFSYQTITVSIAPADNSALSQDYKVAFYYFLKGNKVFTSVLAYDEDKKVDQVALALPNALSSDL